MDRALRRLDAMLLVCDRDVSLTVTGTGDVIEPGDKNGIISIGSGSTYALAASRALAPIEGLDAMEVATRSMRIAADLCVYTSHDFVTEVLDTKGEAEPVSEAEN